MKEKPKTTTSGVHFSGPLGILLDLLFTFILGQLLLQRLNASLVGFNDQFQFAHIVQNGLWVESLHREVEGMGGGRWGRQEAKLHY